MSKPGNGSKPKHKVKAAVRKKQPKSKAAMKHKHRNSHIDGLLRRQAAEIANREADRQHEGDVTTDAGSGFGSKAGTFQVSFESLSISYPEPMFRDTAESRLLLATTRSRFMREMLAVYDRYAEAARNRYNDIDPATNRPQIQPMGMMLVDTTAVEATDTVPETEAEIEANDVPGDYVDDIAGAVV